jgi:hypothetical protein
MMAYCLDSQNAVVGETRMSRERTRRDVLRSVLGLAAGGTVLDHLADSSDGACCYFAAKNNDVNQPAQKAFINWDPKEEQESFTVQPRFEGNAVDFGMVIPTPARPQLDEMPREFFKLLAVFTILEPMPIDKYKRIPTRGFAGMGMMSGMGRFGAFDERRVRLVEEGVVGSLDYKVHPGRRRARSLPVAG